MKHSYARIFSKAVHFERRLQKLWWESSGIGQPIHISLDPLDDATVVLRIQEASTSLVTRLICVIFLREVQAWLCLRPPTAALNEAV
jgi:hypothetical protein